MIGDALLFSCFVLCWIGFKLLRAVGTTEVISFPIVLELIPRCCRIYGHAANRILFRHRRHAERCQYHLNDRDDLALVSRAREAGAAANYTGSGGAVVAVCRDDRHREAVLAKLGGAPACDAIPL